MTHQDYEQFVKDLTSCQLRLHSYILTLLPNSDAANDVLQNTNVVLWRKRNQYTPETNFGAWACKIARYEVLTHCRNNTRDPHVFGEELLSRVATTVERRTEAIDQQSEWLEECLEELADEQRAAILARYQPGGSVKEIAQKQGKSPGAVTKSLARTRQGLFNCMHRKMVEESSP
jgi:RNA polymerase sigma-70 factor (ECF subfamily)